MEEGDKCKIEGCVGIIEVKDRDVCCSCHINPPCSYCTDISYMCGECGEEPEDAFKESIKEQKNNGWAFENLIKSDSERFNELEGSKISWIDITPNDNYYFSVKRGKYPEGTTAKQILENFSLCFGYSYLNMGNGEFTIKYYTQ